MGGTAQANRDTVDAITSRLPVVLGLIAGISLVLLFLLTGSVLLPVKAIMLNVLSLTTPSARSSGCSRTGISERWGRR